MAKWINGEAAGVELTASTKTQMVDIRGFTLDFSQLFNILQQFNKFNNRVLMQLLSTNSTSILPDLLEGNWTAIPIDIFISLRTLFLG